jgi:hypothetical protein
MVRDEIFRKLGQQLAGGSGVGPIGTVEKCDLEQIDPTV